MKNLKRLLSLALTGVMLSGMMVMGASAADFTDADEIVNTEAVDTMVALNIINGKDTGAFDPEGLVTRAEMAKMIATAVNGGVAPTFGVKATPTYTDTKGHWAEQFIEYCSDMKYINGRGNGTFDPNGNVTGTEAAKMVLTALGYESRAYQLTGADWAINTNALAIRNCKPSLYENLNGVSMNLPITRDTAAQLIWNGVQNYIVEYNPNVTITGTDISYGYEKSETTTLLKQAYDANISAGIFKGNGKFLSGLKDGQIQVGVTTLNGNVLASDDPARSDRTITADLDIDYIGEHVKVIWKNEKNTPNGLDAKDKVYGVFITGETEVVNTTRGDIKENKDSDKTSKIKVGSTKYTVATPADSTQIVWKNFGATAGVSTDATATVAEAQAIFEALRDTNGQNPDTVKFVLNESGEVISAYVTNYEIARVTGVSASKVTLSTQGAINKDGNDIYEDIKKDDVVVVTRFYNGSDKDKAFFTVTKAETVEGKVDGFKGSENVVVDGTTYKIISKNSSLPTVSESALTGFATSGTGKAKIGDTVRLYMVGGMVAAAQSLESTAKDWALITDVSWNTTNGLTSTIDPSRISIMTPDGEINTYSLHKDSKKNGTDALDQAATAVGNLIQYSMADGKVKTSKVIPLNVSNKFTLSSTATTSIYNKDTKELTYYPSATADTKVASADAVVFVITDKATVNGTVETSDTFKAYSLRDLGNINAPKSGDAPTNSVYTAVASLNDNNQVEVAVVFTTEKASSNTINTVYGIVKSEEGTRKINDTDYNYYVVSANGEDVDVYTSDSISKGDIVYFDQTSDNCYDAGNVKKVVGTYAAVNAYNADKKLLTYYTWTAANSVGIYEGHGGGKPENITVDKDVKFVYVDTENNTSGDEIAVSAFDSTTGKANILFTKNTDQLVDMIVVETSGNGFGSTPGFTKTSIVAPSAADKKLTVDEVKAAGEGVVFPSSDAVKPDTGFGGSYGDFTKLVFFNFTSKAAGDYTMTIKKGSQVVYTEDLDGLAANTKYVLHVDTLADDGNDSGNTCTWSNGGLKTAGTYTFEIVQDTGSVVVLKGTFQK